MVRLNAKEPADMSEVRKRGWEVVLFGVLTTLLLVLALLALIFPGVVDSLQQLRVLGDLDRYAALLVLTVLVYCVYVLRIYWQLERARELLTVEHVRVESLTSLVEQLKRLLELAASLHVQKSLPETLQMAVNAAQVSLNADHVTLLLPEDPQMARCYSAGSSSLTREQWKALGPRFLEEREPVEAAPEMISQILGAPAPQVKALAIVPMRTEIASVGTLVAEFTDLSPHSGAELYLLRVFAENAMIAINNARLVSQIEQMALTDELTGLYNRRCFQQELSRELARSKRSGHRFAVVLMDIDLFKQVNDTWGHAEGDRVLRGVVEALKTVTRKSTFLARYGGEEFACILPETTLRNAMLGGERMRSAVEVKEGLVRRVTISGGVAAYPEHGMDVSTLMSCADEALYAAKHGGRNRVCAAALPAHNRTQATPV